METKANYDYHTQTHEGVLLDKPRFNMNASTHEEAEEYLRNRAKQLLKFKIRLTHCQDEDEAVIGFFIYKKKFYKAIYILEQFRGKGLYDKYFKMFNQMPILTAYECGIVDFLRKNNYPFECFFIEDSQAYKEIQYFYGDKKAERSGLYLMNHIDEGLGLLSEMNASENAKNAYCLHPILQSDDALRANFNQLRTYHNPTDIILAMEYRSVANEYLSKREINNINEIRLSPLIDVTHMLIADKVQNRKDFAEHHLGKHERSAELLQYFKNWLQRLCIDEKSYLKYKKIIS